MQKQHTKKWLFSLLMSCLCLVWQPHYALAQQQSIQGKVSDVNGQALPGATVLIKGTQNGTITNAEGRFRLSTAQDRVTLAITFIGFETQEVEASSSEEVQVTLQESSKQLNEVVVVGYGTQKKVNLTGAVSVVEGEKLSKRQVGSTSLALQGLAPGVTVTQQSGAPGGDAGTIRIRGIGSINAGQNPLILVDNVEMSLNAIDPNNIESISILKDAAAAAIYGSRAANGVVLITTKRGKEGISINYNTYLAQQKPTNLPEKVNALDHMKLWDVAQVNSGLPPAFTDQIQAYESQGPDNFTRFNTDWKDLVLTNNGLMHNHNLSISAGTEKLKVFASGSFLDQNGLTANTNYTRADMRFNTDLTITDKLSASMDLVLNRTDRNWPGQLSPNTIINRMLGYPATAPGQFDGGQWGEGWSNTNPAAAAEDGGFNRLTNDSRIIKGTLNYRPFEALELLASYSSDNWVSHNKRMTRQYEIYEADPANNTLNMARLWPSQNGLAENTTDNYRNIFRAQATYDKSFGRHNITLLGGFSTEEYQAEFIHTYRQNLLSADRPYLDSGDPIGQVLSGGARRYTMVSAFSRVNYNYDERYLLELNGRWDASSRFREENWWALFPSVSAGWRISEEGFWQGLDNIINDAKIRASYGALGNQNLSDFYPTYSPFSSGPAYNYYFNDVINAGYALTTAANPNIRWETSKNLDIGADLGFFNNRLNITADYFRRDIEDMLMINPIPDYVGLSAPYVNVGSMRNTGWELAAGWRDKVKDFSYQVNVNVSDVKNEVLDIGGSDIIGGSRIIREGHPLHSYYGYVADGLFQSQEEIDNAPFHYGNTAPGDIRYRDISGPEGVPDDKIDNFDRTILGNYFPRYEYSMNLEAQYKGFDLTLFFQGVGKKDNYMSGTGSQPFYSRSYQGSMFEHQKDYWSPENPDAAYPRLTNNSITNNYVTSSYWLKSGAYLRLKNLVVGYTLPKTLTEKMKLGSARIYVSGQNLLTWDDYFPGFDPEQQDTAGIFYPIMKTYTVGLNINF
ncbi:TonB-linked SusC/RagA family outer membrane protein [Catalinimonas alkaloidigena]|uniref:SusC/RagA family TonB-linked outer membrane protein n=1 Tax=Catalinimonas alkaloidigena TaxID=1075417 RepID=UPI0024074FDB|nr:TonB-dependent receptor [Catalinimonas alkaloidigena]MDF9797587.1 TonB-linked SusC/RagA family outer membrane protein [Catalinimonas alkaloidigena]